MSCSRARVPSLHHSKEGWMRHKSNVAKPPLLAQTGWFSLRVSIGKPPRPRGERTLRGIFLIARPPLIVPNDEIVSMLIYGSGACGKCGKAEAHAEAFPSSGGNPHLQNVAEGHRSSCGFPGLRHFPQAVF